MWHQRKEPQVSFTIWCTECGAFEAGVGPKDIQLFVWAHPQVAAAPDDVYRGDVASMLGEADRVLGRVSP